MTRLTIFIVTLFLFGCTSSQTQSKVYFIIKHPDTTKQNFGGNPPPPPPPTLFYGQHNFILIDTSKIFYHHNYVFYSCGTGIDFSKPPRLFLTPDSLIEIQINDLHNFLISTIHDSAVNDRHFSTIISSPTDTIINRAYEIISGFFKSKNLKNYGARNWTEEERYVTTAKIENKPYRPDSLDWKIGFDIEFIPPADTTDANTDTTTTERLLEFARFLDSSGYSFDTTKGYVRQKNKHVLLVNNYAFYDVEFEYTIPYLHIQRVMKDTNSLSPKDSVPDWQLDIRKFDRVQKIIAYFFTKRVPEVSGGEKWYHDGIVEEWKFPDNNSAKQASEELGAKQEMVYTNRGAFVCSVDNYMYVFHTRASGFMYSIKPFFKKFVADNKATSSIKRNWY